MIQPLHRPANGILYALPERPQQGQKSGAVLATVFRKGHGAASAQQTCYL